MLNQTDCKPSAKTKLKPYFIQFIFIFSVLALASLYWQLQPSSYSSNLWSEILKNIALSISSIQTPANKITNKLALADWKVRDPWNLYAMQFSRSPAKGVSHWCYRTGNMIYSTYLLQVTHTFYLCDTFQELKSKFLVL